MSITQAVCNITVRRRNHTMWRKSAKRRAQLKTLTTNVMAGQRRCWEELCEAGMGKRLLNEWRRGQKKTNLIFRFKSRSKTKQNTPISCTSLLFSVFSPQAHSTYPSLYCSLRSFDPAQYCPRKAKFATDQVKEILQNEKTVNLCPYCINWQVNMVVKLYYLRG